MLIYNTMTRTKEPLVPVKEGQVGIYVCGPTVYNYFHVGNARPLVVFDTLRRYLEYRGYKVTYIQNFTDIDDRMIRRANEEGVSVAQLAERYIDAYFVDAAALGVRTATVHPKATEHIKEIIELIETLERSGTAYETDGDVYFNTGAFPGYGRLCGQNLEELEAGARIDIDERKRNPMDFALWKAQKPDEPAWDSPWGPGRPGWHIECSAMAMRYIGETVDIHCGGQDLVFPHHENEIAQSEAATGKPFARLWMHNGFINIDNQKMAKSLNNFFTARDILAEFEPEAMRLFLLSAHYRSPMNFSREQVQQASATLARLYSAREQAAFLLDHTEYERSDEDERIIREIDEMKNAFMSAMDDDLNTADALGSLFELVRILNVELSQHTSRAAIGHFQRAFRDLCGILGILSKETNNELPAVLIELIDARADSRKAKQWKESDRLRDQMRTLGYQVEDTPQGQKVKLL